jgi:secreted PhoX family phosphatase
LALAAALLGGLGSTAAPAAQPVADPAAPLSSVVALTQRVGRPIPDLVRRYTALYAQGTLPATAVFPLPATTSEGIRTISNLDSNLVVKWLDPLTPDSTEKGIRFGANVDFLAYFGDGWDADWRGDVVASAPQFNGSGQSGWLWSNHEYVSNSAPTLTSAPTGQHLTLAKFLRDAGFLTNDVTAPVWPQPAIDTYVANYKRQVGGAWYRIQQNPATRRWGVVPSPNAVRYDATSATLLTLTGQRTRRLDHTDAGALLPPGVVAGIHSDCAGGQTPWGTVVTAEENSQDFYGDLETAWTSAQKFVPGQGFDAGAFINPTTAPSSSSEFSRSAALEGRHDRDVYGYLVEIDPGLPADFFYLSGDESGDGLGHRKVGSVGRARWEGTTFVVGPDYRLPDGKPIVMYGGDDRRGGRIFKWVSERPYRRGMTRNEVRSLLDSGSIWVSHFAGLDNTTGTTLAATGAAPTAEAPGIGRWVRLSVFSSDLAPNGAALGKPTKTVGEALRDVNWNRLGGFRNDTDVRLALFTAANKVGVMELNRPEDVEWNPNDPSGTPRLYVAFTNHGRQVALDQDGRVFDPAEHATKSPLRNDPVGTIFSLQEDDPASPATSYGFKFFRVWQGTKGTGIFDAADPDNILIDSKGGVWFGTDGNFGTNGTADAFYYLDLDPRHRAGVAGVTNPSFGKAFRVAAVPSDAETTGPAFSADEATIFLSVQHPGEERQSSWPPR